MDSRKVVLQLRYRCRADQGDINRGMIQHEPQCQLDGAAASLSGNLTDLVRSCALAVVPVACSISGVVGQSGLWIRFFAYAMFSGEQTTSERVIHAGAQTISIHHWQQLGFNRPGDYVVQRLGDRWWCPATVIGKLYGLCTLPGRKIRKAQATDPA